MRRSFSACSPHSPGLIASQGIAEVLRASLVMTSRFASGTQAAWFLGMTESSGTRRPFW